jgi:hypothetical protein
MIERKGFMFDEDWAASKRVGHLTHGQQSIKQQREEQGTRFQEQTAGIIRGVKSEPVIKACARVENCLMKKVALSPHSI